jgi:hypothetical protein
MQNIVIRVGQLTLRAELNESETAKSIAAALPLSASANVWGDEIYFDIPVAADEDTDARADVEIGTLAYWPPGNAFCIFYGPTPVSSGAQPRAASPVNIVGRVLDDVLQLKGTRNGADVDIVVDKA